MDDTFDLTARERDLVAALSELLARAIEDACPRLSVQTIDLELRPAPAPAPAPLLSAIA